MVLVSFIEVGKSASENFYTPIFEVMEQAVVRTFLTGRTDELLGDLMYELAESENFAQRLVFEPV